MALDAGAKKIIVCLGGSATTDGGLGGSPGDPRAAAPSRRQAARRVRRPHRVRRRSNRVRPAEGCVARAGATADRAPRTNRADLPRGLRRRRDDDRRRRRRRRPGRRARGTRRDAGARASTWSPTSSTCTTRSPLPTSSITGEGRLDEQSFEGKVVGRCRSSPTLGRQAGRRDRRQHRARTSRPDPTRLARRAVRPRAGDERAAVVHRARRDAAPRGTGARAALDRQPSVVDVAPATVVVAAPRRCAAAHLLERLARLVGAEHHEHGGATLERAALDGSRRLERQRRRRRPSASQRSCATACACAFAGS